MADISKVVLPNDATTYNIKDASARTSITNLQSSKQDTLVSGTNIKTIRGQSIVGSGDLPLGPYCGYCGSDADARYKVSTISNLPNSIPYETVIYIRFENAQEYEGTSGSGTYAGLTINGVTKYIALSTTATMDNGRFLTSQRAWEAGDIVAFMYEEIEYNPGTFIDVWVMLERPFTLDRQEKLVSGTNIKTINGNSILGSGNLTPANVLPTSTKNHALITDKNNSPVWSGLPIWYGTCTTAAATQAKVATVTGLTELFTGAMIRVKFTYEQTYNGAPTLNVNSLGAKNIRRPSGTSLANAVRYEWGRGAVLDFVYDGTYWVISDRGLASTTYYGFTKLQSSVNNATNTALDPYGAVVYCGNMWGGEVQGNWASTSSYSVNTIVRKDHHYYKCTTAVPSGGEAWTPSHWQDLGHWPNLPYITYFTTSADYGVYEVGERVFYNGFMYKCLTAITAGAAWDATKWEQISPAMFNMPTQASIDNSGLITYKNLDGGTCFTLQLPLFDGSVT